MKYRLYHGDTVKIGGIDFKLVLLYEHPDGSDGMKYVQHLEIPEGPDITAEVDGVEHPVKRDWSGLWIEVNR